MQDVTSITADPGYAKRILLVAMELKFGGARIVSERRKEPNPISDSNCIIPWRGKL